MVALFAASLAFAGGTPSDFASALREATGRDAFVVVGRTRQVPAVRITEATDADLLSAGIRSQAKLRQLPGLDLILTDELLPDDRMSGVVNTDGRRPGMMREDQQMAVNTGRGGKTVNIPSSAVKDGKIEFKTPGDSALSLNGSFPFSKPLRVHWFFESFRVSVDARGLTETEFVTRLARGLGGRLQNSPTEYSIRLDPSEVRSRLRRTIAAMPSSQGNAVIAARLNLTLAAVDLANNAQLEEALAAPGSSVNLSAPLNSAAGTAAANLLRTYAQATENNARPGRGGRGPSGRWQAILQRADSRRPMVIVLRSDFGVRASIPILNPDGSPGPYANIP